MLFRCQIIQHWLAIDLRVLLELGIGAGNRGSVTPFAVRRKIQPSHATEGPPRD